MTQIITKKVGQDEFYARFAPGHPESISVQGSGKTRSAAIADLRRQQRDLLADAKQQNADFVSQK